METTRSRSAVLAQFLRAALKDVNESTGLGGSGTIVLNSFRYSNALESIEAVAGELEAVAVGAAPDPAGGR